ncbi:MAG: GntR family transcriptional regulator YhfZ, partial [Streptomyces sp.]
VWNLDEVRDHLGPDVEALPLDDEITRDLALRNSSAALIGRAVEARTRELDAVRGSLDFSLVTEVQGEVLRGERVPLY